MARRSNSGSNLRSRSKEKDDRFGKLIVSKCGVYMICSDEKVSSIQLISWEQFLNATPPRADIKPI